jgi:hypothetical protein
MNDRINGSVEVVFTARCGCLHSKCGMLALIAEIPLGIIKTGEVVMLTIAATVFRLFAPRSQ